MFVVIYDTGKKYIMIQGTRYNSIFDTYQRWMNLCYGVNLPTILWLFPIKCSFISVKRSKCILCLTLDSEKTIILDCLERKYQFSWYILHNI